MRLRDYLDGREESAGDFAIRLGVSESTVSRYLSGSRVPRRDVLERIVRITRGRVTANDFYQMVKRKAA